MPEHTIHPKWRSPAIQTLVTISAWALIAVGGLTGLIAWISGSIGGLILTAAMVGFGMLALRAKKRAVAVINEEAGIPPAESGPGLSERLQGGWTRYRGWPAWGQVIAAVVVLGLLGSFGSGADSPTSEQAVIAAADADVEPSPTPTAKPTRSPKPSPSPSPEPELPEELPASSTTVIFPDKSPAEAQAAVVERIVDGDTIWVRVDEDGGPLTANASHNIRLLLIDTPETVHPSKPVECGGPEASEFTATALSVGSTVWLVADQEDTDRYGRFLRYVFTDDGTFFNEEAVKQGHATAVMYAPNDAQWPAIQEAQAEAKAASRGIWGEPCNMGAPTPPPPPPPPPAAEPEPEPVQEESAQQTQRPYKNCTEAREAGAAPVHRGDPGYGSHLDRDDDGVGCE